MPHTSAKKAELKPQAKTRTGNGKDILPDVDGRSQLGRRIRELLADFVSDMGGQDNVSAAKLAIAKRSAVLLAWAEAQEAVFVNGGDFNVETYGTTINTLRRLLCDVGLQRHARDVTPSFSGQLRRSGAA